MNLRGRLPACVGFIAFVAVLVQTSPVHEVDEVDSNLATITSSPATALNSGFHPSDILTARKKLQCEDVHRATDKCAFIQTHCDDLDNGILPYLDLYFCDMYKLTPLYWALMVIWLVTLFASIGVSASDYLTLNLATLSTKMKLSGTVAGVTLLALGNGSPDLFSTFQAMGSNSGSLAIGELIGAAGFITTIVAAATAIPKPFRVKKYAFMRDIICFAVAVGFSMFFLIDGHIAFWECCVMVLGYCGYVLLVVSWHLIIKRFKKGRHRQARARGHFTAPSIADRSREPSPVAMGDIDGVPIDDRAVDERTQLLGAVVQDPEEEDETEPEAREQLLAEMANITNQMRVTHRQRRTFSRITNTGQPIRPSLLGAAEFGSVLSSLERSRSTRTRSSSPQARRSSTGPVQSLSASQGDVSKLSPDRRSQATRTASESASLQPPDRVGGARVRAVSASAATGLKHGRIHGPAIAGGVHLDHGATSTNHFQAQTSAGGVQSRRPDLQRLQIPVPTINVSDEAGQPSAVTADDESTLAFPRYTDDPDADLIASPGSLTPVDLTWPRTRSRRIRDRIGHALSQLRDTLLPQILPWNSKSWLDKTLSIITIPIIVGLTLTVPVGEIMVDSPESAAPVTSSTGAVKNSADAETSDDRTSRITSGSISPLLSPVSEQEDALAQRDIGGDDDTWSPYLMSFQILAAPLFVFFVVYKVWLGIEDNGWPMMIWCCSLLGASLIVLAIFWIFNVPKQVPTWQSWLAVPGFFVSIAWISLIADEVVGVLKTFQLISGFSEAILGLLVFAAGNSVSDLFANLNTARAGNPVMAFHACFGGPMLNILTGIGIGGIFRIAKKWAKHNGKHNDGTFPHADTQFHIEVGRTLVISGSGLLLTLAILLVSVWRNNWIMDRKIGALMVFLWVIITVVNVTLECLQLNGTIKPW